MARFVPFRSLFLLPWLGPSARLGSAYFARTQPRRRPRKASLSPSHHALPLGEPHFPRPAVGHGDCGVSRNHGRGPSIQGILVYCIHVILIPFNPPALPISSNLWQPTLSSSSSSQAQPSSSKPPADHIRLIPVTKIKSPPSAPPLPSYLPFLLFPP